MSLLNSRQENVEALVSRWTLIADFIIDGGFMTLKSPTDEGA
jgi:hypothetical protein